MASGITAEMAVGVIALLRFLSGLMMLEPDDLVLTGTRAALRQVGRSRNRTCARGMSSSWRSTGWAGNAFAW